MNCNYISIKSETVWDLFRNKQDPQRKTAGSHLFWMTDNEVKRKYNCKSCEYNDQNWNSVLVIFPLIGYNQRSALCFLK